MTASTGSMRKWLADMLGRAADTVGDAVSDARAKLIDEAWFGRRTSEGGERSGLGWFPDHPSASERTIPSHERDRDPRPQEQDRGIDL